MMCNKNGQFPISYYSILPSYFNSEQWKNKTCRWPDSNPCPWDFEATAVPTVLQTITHQRIEEYYDGHYGEIILNNIGTYLIPPKS